MRKKIFVILILLTLPAGTISVRGYDFFNGEGWKKFSSYNFSPDEERNLKKLFIKTVYETTVFTGKPLITLKKDDLTTYVKFIDKFYQRKGNRIIPLYHSLKIVEMLKKRMPEEKIQSYVIAVLKKLKQLKLIK